MKNDSLDVSLQRGLYVAQDGLHCVRQAFEGGGVKTPRKRSTRRSGAALRASVARLVSVAVMGLGYMSSLPPLTDAGSVRRWI